VRACIPSSCASFTVEHWGSEGFAVCDAATCPPLPAPNGASAIEFIDASGQRDWEMVGMLGVQVKDPALTFWRLIWVRLRVTDQAGNSIFDSSALVQSIMFQPTDLNWASLINQSMSVPAGISTLDTTTPTIACHDPHHRRSPRA